MSESTDLSSLAKAAEQVLKNCSFELFSPLGDRHGSWEIIFYKPPPEGDESQGGTCFVSLALTSLPTVLGSRTSYDVEIRAGVDTVYYPAHGEHFMPGT